MDIISLIEKAEGGLEYADMGLHAGHNEFSARHTFQLLEIGPFSAAVKGELFDRRIVQENIPDLGHGLTKSFRILLGKYNGNFVHLGKLDEVLRISDNPVLFLHRGR